MVRQALEPRPFLAEIGQPSNDQRPLQRLKVPTEDPTRVPAVLALGELPVTADADRHDKVRIELARDMVLLEGSVSPLADDALRRVGLARLNARDPSGRLVKRVLNEGPSLLRRPSEEREKRTEVGSRRQASTNASSASSPSG